jgi:hypothetical protein
VAAQPAGRTRSVNPEEFAKVSEAVTTGHSVLVIGEVGSGILDFALALHEQYAKQLTCALVTYKGSGKLFLQALAQQVGISTETEEGKPLTVDQLKEEIALSWGRDTLLILPEAKRLPAGLRYWLQDAVAAGVQIVAFAPSNPGRDLFLSLLEVELALPTDAYIRLVMAAEAQHQGLVLSKSRLAELQPLAGRNPMLARKVIQREALGLNQDKPEHTQYIVVMPIIVAMLLAFGIIRFIGFGTGNRGLYVTGGICLVGGMMLKQLGQVRGARKRLGQ